MGLKFFAIALCLLGVAWDTPATAATATTTAKKKKAHVHRVVTAKPDLTGPLYATRPDAMQAADAMAEKRGLDRQWVRAAIGQARFQASVAKASQPPPAGVPKNWALYRSRFIEPLRIAAGVKFWNAHQDTLRRAEAELGVPASIIVGIVGVETIYGQQTGNYRVIDALSTLAFDFPANHPRAQTRTEFFRSELEEYLALTARTQTDPLALRGSYAGAMGLPQFMPSSWSRYAIDFDGDGRIDLFHSAADVIGSVAHYFKKFQWQTGMPTHYTLHFDEARLDKAALLVPDILPTFSVADMAARGAMVDAAGQTHAGPLALVELQNGEAPPQYVAGTQNFYAITRYNWSSYYAMAVIELGQAVAAAMPK